ncbi:hypothetical protein BWQ96_07116 [Gracilariopsis chorda]|uniref:Uncharacterized protein n=1 Tax=Gracilariopsis chorda TaxID=448386 RepID=A0A2V3IM63_9FLOR|nr:hypothetical protein BWQ96_07116 [Gracilariopsis chorda]|eukprot:PXF43172.1 hypothetical protein BWQ96_07116 [Gracilariopsis chorda]
MVVGDTARYCTVPLVTVSTVGCDTTKGSNCYSRVGAKVTSTVEREHAVDEAQEAKEVRELWPL